jgi:excisionase family DNA binding protein
VSEPGLSLAVPSALVDALADRVAAKLVTQLPAPGKSPFQEGNGRLALRKAEAAEKIGVSIDHFERHVMPELRIVRQGRLRLIPVAELEQWVERHAARTLGGER